MNYTYLTQNCAEKKAEIKKKIDSHNSCLINKSFKLEIYSGLTQ